MRATGSKLVVICFYMFGCVRGYDAWGVNAGEVGEISKLVRNTG
jgi:hypothetical protein